ncbi:hypothetical protein N7532_011858 [Penicillium argentinense]|uniref:Zn(2)-C6 fungal-type domain-containing protein n=1 Tax=Penicillium argentinense TaxID=1131581 RepID=A0A9W9JVC5_9EURO|nr:uncharacterized protein N7532_011858 [Penicillium argentinense]KAJ5082815.1 hypothetical protein N7532_011858 [Penicillium argentinense]
MPKRGGIPWQSKGCWTCRKRKIKCDQRKPECERCIKRDIQCLGYEKTRTFIYHSYEEPEKKHDAGNQLQRIARTHKVAPVRTVASEPMMREQVFSSFVDLCFPTHMDVSNVDMWRFLVQNFSILPGKSDMLEKTISSVSCLFLGKINHDDRMFNQGLRLYNSAVRQMAKMISQDAYSDDLVYTAVIFQEIESCYCPNGLQTWLAHIKGVNTLLKHYRHKAVSNPLIEAIYHRYQKLRTLMCSSAINMPADEYKYMTEEGDGSPLSELLKAFAELSPISVKVQSIDPSDYDACQDLLQHGVRAKEQLFAWYSEHHMAETISPSSPRHFTTTNMPSSKGLFEAPYSFTSFDCVLLHMYYWAALAMLLPMIFHAKTLIRSHRNSGIPAELLSQVTDPFLDEDYLCAGFYADEICRCMPYCMQDKMKNAGFHMTLFPLCAASQTYINFANLEKFAWCVKILEQADSRGHATAPYLVDISWNNWFLKNDSRPNVIVASSLREIFPDNTPSRELQNRIELIDE